jgi:5-methyltetrahydropteroyltriglutamate--homocysteine methyltransferase
MALQQNTDRIQTTHIGSLPRPHRLLDAMKAKYSGGPHDPAAFQRALRSAVADVVRKQVDGGIDIVTDGEFSKPGFFTYIRERLEGFESRPNMKIKLFRAGGRRVSGILWAIFQAGDDGRGHRLARTGRLRRPG